MAIEEGAGARERETSTHAAMPPPTRRRATAAMAAMTPVEMVTPVDDDDDVCVHVPVPTKFGAHGSFVLSRVPLVGVVDGVGELAGVDEAVLTGATHDAAPTDPAGDV